MDRWTDGDRYHRVGIRGRFDRVCQYCHHRRRKWRQPHAIESVNKFFDVQSPPAARNTANEVSMRRPVGRSWLLSAQNSSAFLEPISLSGQYLNSYAAFLLPPTETALQFDGVNDHVTFGDTKLTPGTLSGTPTWNTTVNSKLGSSSLGFNGTSQYVTFGAAPGLGAVNFTLEAWFYWTGGGATTTTGGTGGLTIGAIPLVAKGRGEADGDNRDLNYFLGIQGGKLAADFEEGPGGPGPLGLNHAILGNTTITTNSWRHAAVTYDSVNAVWVLYLDGVQDATLDVGSNIPPRSDSIQHASIATAMNSTGVAAGFFPGRMDEVRIWNIVRTEAEIQAAMNSEILVPTNGLLGRWGMNDVNNGAGTTSATASNINRLGATSFTLEAWVNRGAGGATMTTGTNGLDGASGRPLAFPVLAKGMGEGENPTNINTNWFLGITDGGVIGADFEDTAGGVNHPAWGTTTVPIGGWHHIAVTYTGNCWAMYLDGNPETLNGSVVTCPNATPESTSYQRAGLSAGINSTGGLAPGYFSGAIDEARVWNRALDASEILANKDLEITSGTGLLARWGLNEGSGTTIEQLHWLISRDPHKWSDVDHSRYDPTHSSDRPGSDVGKPTREPYVDGEYRTRSSRL